uniref:Olfactory receptor 119 n=1 Tax=Aulacocentrum confusum TaxID=2767324 RepID=A0A7G8Z9D8_9HYME|nr:olfactory receptor 119 [Aulacocentrum confusum]
MVFSATMQNIQDPFHYGYYAINRKMWEMFGIWPEQKRSTRIWTQIIHVLLTISVVIPEVVYFVKIYNDLDLVAQSVPTFLVIIAAGIKFFTIGLNGEFFLQSFNHVRADWIKYGKSFAQETMHAYAYKGYQGTIMYASTIILFEKETLILFLNIKTALDMLSFIN